MRLQIKDWNLGADIVSIANSLSEFIETVHPGSVEDDVDLFYQWFETLTSEERKYVTVSVVIHLHEMA